MKKIICIACCSFFMLTGCGKESYFQSTELVEATDETMEDNEVVEENLSEVIYVQVAGAVAKPDVYELPAGSRVYAAIDAAGGLLDSADDTDINQAALLEDGQKLYVYTIDEAEQLKLEQMELEEQAASDGLVNINTASLSELTTLPGIGQTKANQIIAYREANGNFTSIEDIKNVSGIGDGIFNQINSLIKI